VGQFSASTQVTFTKASPDTIFIQPEKSSVARFGGTVVINTLLVRDVGLVTNNTAVSYEARDAAGTPIGTFLAPSLATTDPADAKRLKSTVTFDPDDTAALGAATITAHVGGKSASAVIQITGTPDKIFVQSDVSSISRASGTATITTYLFGDIVRTGAAIVTYEARDSGGTVIGTFLGPTLATPDPADTTRLKSTVTFDPDTTAALGTATITARSGDLVTSTAVQILP
jgi:hypothetical protein